MMQLPENLILEGSPAHFEYLDGRRFVSSVPYALPKDSGEMQRLDFQHFLLKYGLQGNFLAPIEQPAHILDVGCGTGRWAMELAQQFPKATVTGVDLVATEQAQPPENYTFVKGNVLEGLPFEDNRFDFVHQRLLVAALPRERWPFVIGELARVTRPGGWVELAECGSPQDDPANPYPQLWATWIAFCQTRAIDFTIGHTIGSMLQQGALQQVQRHEVVFPMGQWGGRIGSMSAEDCLAVGKALRAGVVAAGIKTAEQYDTLFAGTGTQFIQPTGQSKLPFYIAYGQKG